MPSAERGGEALPGRGALATARLAIATVAGVAGAILALAPLAFRRGPSRARASGDADAAASAAPAAGPLPARLPPAASPPAPR